MVINDELAHDELETAFKALTPAVPSFSDVTADLREALAEVEADLADLEQDDPEYRALLKTRGDLQRLLASAAPSGSAARPLQATPSLTYPQALERVGQFVVAHSSAAARTGLAQALKGAAPGQAAQFAATAAARNKPVAALAALLTAHRSAPRNPAHPVNVGGLLCALGQPQEALAFLAEAERLKSSDGPMGLSARAILLTTRGRALLLLGRFKDAEPLLREAVRLDPWLSEAQRNLALALRGLGKKPEALRAFRAGMRRNPSAASEAAATTGQPETVPQSPGGDQNLEAVTGRQILPAGQAFDLSAGKDGRLPSYLYPKTAADGPDFLPKMQALTDTFEARQKARVLRLAQLHQQASQQARTRLGTPGAALEQAWLQAIMHRVLFYDREPSLRAKWRLVEEQFNLNRNEVVFPVGTYRPDSVTTEGAEFDARTNSGQWSQAMLDFDEQQREETRKCVSAECSRAAQRKYDLKRCDVTMAAHNRWRTAMVGLDTAYAQAFNPTYRLLSGLLGNISDPVSYELYKLTIEMQLEERLRLTLFAPAVSPEPLWITVEGLRGGGVFCGEPEKTAALEDLVLTSPERCTLVGPYKVKVKLVGSELSFNCEKVAVEVEGPGVGVLDSFGEVEMAFDGKLTLVLGVKAGGGVGPIELGPGAKGGCYLTVDLKNGSFVDAGVKGSVSGGASAGPIGVEYEAEYPVSFIPS